MEGYKHGAYVREVKAKINTPAENAAGIHVVFGTAPVNMAEEPEKAVNRLVVAEDFEEAKKKLGYSEDFGKFTLCQAMDAYFKIFSVGPVAFCNVLDPGKHKKQNGEKECRVEGMQVVLEEEGIIQSSLEVKTAEGTKLIKEEDYIASFDNEGKMVVTLFSSGKGAEAEKLVISSESIAPEMVGEADIIGGADVETGEEAGMELVRRVYPVCGRYPGCIMAPGWSHKKNVAAVMAQKSLEINGVFRCECLVDLDTELAGRHTECGKVKEESGMVDPQTIALWPMAKAGGRKYYYSAVFGAMMAWEDAENDGIPCASPSNKLLRIDSAVLADDTEVNLDLPEANMLNGQGIVTILNSEGMRSWGNNTAAYPYLEDVKEEINDRWVNCRRAFSWWGNSFIATCRKRVDSPANYRLIETIVDEENIRGNSYVQQGKFAGARMEYDKYENGVDSIMEGRIVVRQYLAPYTPAEYILNILSFDPSLLENALGGN